jgi:hypothetical protein
MPARVDVIGSGEDPRAGFSPSTSKYVPETSSARILSVFPSTPKNTVVGKYARTPSKTSALSRKSMNIGNEIGNGKSLFDSN